MSEIKRITFNYDKHCFSIYHNYEIKDEDIEKFINDLIGYSHDKSFVPLKVYMEFPKYDDIEAHEYYIDSDDESVYNVEYNHPDFDWKYDNNTVGILKFYIADYRYIPNIIAYMLFKNYIVIIK